MKNPWDNDPVVGATPWDNDPVASQEAAIPKSVLPRTMTFGEQLNTHPLVKGLTALGETGLALGTGAITAAGGGLAGITTVGKNLIQGKDFSDSLGAGADVINKVTSTTYQPQSDLGKVATDAALYLPKKAIEGWRGIGGEVGELAGNRELGETLGGVGMESFMTVAPVPKVLKQAAAPKPPTLKQTLESYGPERQTQKQITSEVNKVAQLEGAEAAQRQGVAIDLKDIDPNRKITRWNTTPDDVQKAMSEANKGIPEMKLKAAVGIPDETPLDLRAIDTNLEALSGPKKQIQAMQGFIDDTGTTVNTIRQFTPRETVGMAENHKRVVDKINEITNHIEQGKGVGSGAAIIESIEVLRQEARDLYSKTDISKKDRDFAKVYQGTADALEALLERKLKDTNPQLLNQYVQNRQKMAQTYVLRDILDDNGKTVNLAKLARLTSNDAGITGAFKDFGKVYTLSPESFKAPPKETGMTRWSRYTIPGTLGAGFGATLGLDPVVGAGLGVISRDWLAGRSARKMASPEYQSRYTEALRNRTPSRTDLGYEPVPPPLELAPQGPLPPSPMGGIQVGTGPRDTGVVNLAPQLGAGMPSPGTGPGPLLRSGRAGPEPIYPKEGPTSIPQQTGMSREPTPQMPTVEMPLKPEMSQQFLSEMMDAMAKGDMETVARLEQQYAAAQAALESQSPHAAHDLLYEPFRRRQEMPSMPSGPSAFSEALRNFRGAQ